MGLPIARVYKEIEGYKMKYNKQLFDNIQKEYNQLLELAEFIYDQLLNDQTDNKRYETLSNLDLYVQGLLANIILDNDPKILLYLI